jgi:hypothetical protein
MEEREGHLACVAGGMTLSKAVQETLCAMFRMQEPRAEPVELGFGPTRWFCAGCGVPLEAHECPRCGKSILSQGLWYQLVEFHPHLTKDGKWG